MLEAGQPEDLGHLRDVAEHVGQVSHLHGAAELGRAPQAELEVADDRLARDHELVHEDHPRPHRQAAGGGQAAQRLGRLGPYLEVVVDDDGLAVEQETGVAQVALEEGEELVEQPDEPGPEHLERRVPLPVPMRVRDDPHGRRRHRGQDTGRRRGRPGARPDRQSAVRGAFRFVHEPAPIAKRAPLTFPLSRAAGLEPREGEGDGALHGTVRGVLSTPGPTTSRRTM